ncbi:MAG: helix-turn-helix transcriptional regulator [Clostridia bacterium]|nr:helix-turn-helix transcriptional regulator [Clostridia bacterium]MBR1718142.1 helix-turn-helix transcriptional regulator [Bacilli bacterium]
MKEKKYHTELERLNKVIKWLIFSDFVENDKDLADKLGYNKTYLSQIFNGKVALSDNFIEKLIDLDPNINKVWIKTGTGNMLKSDSHHIITQTVKANGNISNAGNNNINIPIQTTASENIGDKNIIKELRSIIKDKENTINLLSEELKANREELKEKTSHINRLLTIIEKQDKQ